MRHAAATLAIMLALSGCASGGSQMSTPSDQPSPIASVTPTPTPAPSGSASVSAQRWQAILADLAGRGVATDAVEVVSSRDVTWNDGSLGCPKPGRFYTQALVPGQQVVVQADGRTYDYRFGRGESPRLCEK